MSKLVTPVMTPLAKMTWHVVWRRCAIFFAKTTPPNSKNHIFSISLFIFLANGPYLSEFHYLHKTILDSASSSAAEHGFGEGERTGLRDLTRSKEGRMAT
jgi:hypothetical protein